MSSFADARDGFVRGYLRAHPEEATTLGLHDFDARLRGVDEEAVADELATAKGFLASLDALDCSTLPLADELDARALERHARFRARSLDELDLPRRSLEASIHPHAMLAHQAAHVRGAEGWAPFAERLAALPAHYRALERNLREGLARGHVPDRALTAAFSADLLPGAATWLDAVPELPLRAGHALDPATARALEDAARLAARALREHASFFERDLMPRARDTFALGEAEVSERLRAFFGITRAPADLVEEAEDRLRIAQAELVRAADRVARADGARVRTLDEATNVVLALFGRSATSAAEIVPLYERLTERALAFVTEHLLFTVPHDFHLGVIPLPAGVAHGTSATNWPAPLTDPRGAGHVAVSLDPSMCSIPAAANLAVHEGLPGHTLQSVLFQRAFEARPHLSVEARLARYLALPDDEAMAQGYFGPMLNVEGFAVWAEELLLREGYLDDEETVCALAGKAIRAARVVVDLGLHALHVTRDEAASFLARETGMSLGWSRAQALRYSRIPLQAVTYDLGALETRRVLEVAKRARGGKVSFAELHDRFLASGPLWPSEIALELDRP